MSGVDVLLDTNAVIAFNKVERTILWNLARFSVPAISLFTLGELHFGARKSGRAAENLANIRSTLRDLRLLLPDEGTASHYGILREKLRRKGRPIPENDIWIAALTLQHGLPLATRDAHFSEIDGLEPIGW